MIHPRRCPLILILFEWINFVIINFYEFFYSHLSAISFFIGSTSTMNPRCFRWMCLSSLVISGSISTSQTFWIFVMHLCIFLFRLCSLWFSLWLSALPNYTSSRNRRDLILFPSTVSAIPMWEGKEGQIIVVQFMVSSDDISICFHFSLSDISALSRPWRLFFEWTLLLSNCTLLSICWFLSLTFEISTKLWKICKKLQIASTPIRFLSAYSSSWKLKPYELIDYKFQTLMFPAKATKDTENNCINCFHQPFHGKLTCTKTQ